MGATLVLLCPPDDARHLAAVLAGANRDLTVVSVADGPQLERCVAETGRVDRIVSFRTNTIVPPGILHGIAGTSYNFHPAPPEYPGRHPFSFALYDGVASYGVTAHEMVERVDAGPIVGALRFPLPADPDPHWLIDRAHTALIQLFILLAPALARPETALPRTTVAWGSRRCSRKALDRLLALPAGIAPDELERRIKAAGPVRDEGIHPSLTLHGHRFVLAGD